MPSNVYFLNTLKNTGLTFLMAYTYIFAQFPVESWVVIIKKIDAKEDFVSEVAHMYIYFRHDALCLTALKKYKTKK